MREEGFSALYRGLVPGLFLILVTPSGIPVSAPAHGAIQFTAYEELRNIFVDLKSRGSTVHRETPDQLLNSVDYAVLGASSKIAAILLSYPFQVIRSRLQQRPGGDGVPRYIDSLPVMWPGGGILFSFALYVPRCLADMV
ncbi:folate transporter 1, chloroplastic-like [Lotus japonicus]|uniref:folate transporter 1, chloroplastic-like n=1 Tax=Lotus japonicus TaxID=34305 RepID=UPI002585C88B|nr:folate transporter 1, chloroplastic-like [Lotus japonicus]